MKSTSLFLSLFWLGLVCTQGLSREWADKTGNVKVNGTLIAADQKDIVVKLDQPVKGRELLAIEIAQLSDADQKFLMLEESEGQLKSATEKHSWSLRNGMNVFGKVVGFNRKDVTLQRRRGKLYVNDRPFDNLPEVYRKMIPRIVEHFEKKTFANDSQFNDWVLAQKAEARTFTCEGVLMELPNGEEYGIPFFFFKDTELTVLQPQWDEWLAANQAAKEDEETKRQQSLYLQSQAAAYQQSVQQNQAYQQEMMQIARMQLQMQAVAAGVFSMWEVYLYPPAGVAAYPISVVVNARNSFDAANIASANNPGYVVGPIRKFAGY
ncbi:MAG: hypothetical protein KGS49_08800 [Planctomycetes bacterium]|jgi:hypothetical protein|nr:hypothetical protein [Planctomycetota bacterium]